MAKEGHVPEAGRSAGPRPKRENPSRLNCKGFFAIGMDLFAGHTPVETHVAVRFSPIPNNTAIASRDTRVRINDRRRTHRLVSSTTWKSPREFARVRGSGRGRTTGHTHLHGLVYASYRTFLMKHAHLAENHGNSIAMLSRAHVSVISNRY